METCRVNGAYGFRQLAALYAAWLGVLYYVVVYAWVAEDAYITFRVLDNFFAGYGLRWNIHDRVQAYTHPLWMLLHIAFRPVWNNLFLETIALSVICTMAALALPVFTGPRLALRMLFLFFVPLMLSKSFRNYTSSGLENPLSYLLYAALGYVLLKKYDHKYFWAYASLAAALLLLNRLDFALLIGPALLYLAASRFRAVEWKKIMIGASPLFAWFAFALLYYGFIFPNTKYAKLHTGLPLSDYLTQGLYYVNYLLVLDTPGAVMLGSMFFFLFRPKWFREHTPPGLPMLPFFLALGIVIYCLYVVYVGGDYMAGRFWSVPIFAGAWLWAMFFPAERLRYDLLFLAMTVMLSAFAASPMLDDIRKNCGNCIALKGRVMDAFFTFTANRLFSHTYPFAIRKQGHYPFGKEGKKLARLGYKMVKPMYFAGMTPYYAGPRVTVIDELGLGDPLLARLPAEKQHGFYIGHFRRKVPDGYEFALESGKLERMPRSLAKYYGKLQLIVSGPLLDPERLKTIALFNLGYYDHWKEEYLAKQPK